MPNKEEYKDSNKRCQKSSVSSFCKSTKMTNIKDSLDLC